MVIAVAGIAAGTIIATSQKKEAQPTEKDTVVVVKETANSAAPAAEAQKPTASKPAAQPAKQAIDNSNVSYGSQGPWHIRDLSGFTNIRNAPNGKVCMRLWDHTQYTIYTDAEVNGWLRMTYCYNESKGYQVRFHSSSTGSYWIHRSVLY